MIHLCPKQVGSTSQQMYGIFRNIVRQADPSAKIKPWGKLCRISKVAWDEVAIWHLRKTGEIKERTTKPFIFPPDDQGQTCGGYKISQKKNGSIIVKKSDVAKS